MNTLLCADFWTELFPTIWWGLVVAVIFIVLLCVVKTLVKASLQNRLDVLNQQYEHERLMKQDAFEREKEWKDIKQCQKNLEEKYSKQIAELEQEKATLESKFKALKNWNELMQSTQETYLELYKKLESEIKPKRS